MENKKKFMELYIELMKCRRDGSNSSHIQVTESIGVYCDNEVLTYYITNNEVPSDGHISYDIGGGHCYVGNGKPLENIEILNIMELCLKDWQ